MTVPVNPIQAAAARCDFRAPPGATWVGSADGRDLCCTPVCGGSGLRVTDPRSSDLTEAVIAVSPAHLWDICTRPEAYFSRPTALYGEAALDAARLRELAERSALKRALAAQAAEATRRALAKPPTGPWPAPKAPRNRRASQEAQAAQIDPDFATL